MTLTLLSLYMVHYTILTLITLILNIILMFEENGDNFSPKMYEEKLKLGIFYFYFLDWIVTNKKILGRYLTNYVYKPQRSIMCD